MHTVPSNVYRANVMHVPYGSKRLVLTRFPYSIIPRLIVTPFSVNTGSQFVALLPPIRCQIATAYPVAIATAFNLQNLAGILFQTWRCHFSKRRKVKNRFTKKQKGPLVATCVATETLTAVS